MSDQSRAVNDPLLSNLPTLGYWKAQILTAWEAVNPAMVQSLRRKKTLEAVVNALAERVSQMYKPLVESGLQPGQAWEMVREEWRLPSELE